MPLHPSIPAIAVALALAACAHKNPLYCDESTPCEPGFICDEAGSYPASEGVGHTCIPNLFDAAPESFCTADAFVQCADESTALYCNAEGTEYVAIPCDLECSTERGGCYCEPNTSHCADDTNLACDEDGVAHIKFCALGCDVSGDRCVDVAPSNDLGEFLDQTDDAPAVTLADGATIDTDDGTITTSDGNPVDVPSFQIAASPGGVAIRVFAFKSLTIGDALVEGTRAIAIVSDGDVVIEGILDVRAGEYSQGECVGHSSTCETTNCGGAFCPGGCPGAGGGAFGSAGSRGGTMNVDGLTGVYGAGGTTSGTASLVPLRGGCRGGKIGENNASGTADGGGAIQIVSRTTVKLDDLAPAFVTAGGRGGRSSGGLGGGSGGGILLEAPRVVVPSNSGLTANGGGGGCNSDPGENGKVSTVVALGGTCDDNEYGSGGDGAAGSIAARVGTSVSSPTVDSFYLGGGGGGGVGRIRINVPIVQDLFDAGKFSPAPVIGTLATR